MKKIIKTAFFLALIIAIAAGGYFAYKSFMENKNKWKLEILNEYINVRTEPSPYEAKLGTVSEGEVYHVLEMYLEDNKFVWYKINFTKSRNGWIASDRNEPFVKEINNSNFKGEDAHLVDYALPLIKFFDLEYHTKDLSTITYDHLDISHGFDYELTSQVYIEECQNYTYYWIEYKATDIFGKSSKKLQQIVFEDEPSSKEVASLSKIREEICVND